MKIIKDDVKFQPITIVIESQAELDAIYYSYAMTSQLGMAREMGGDKCDEDRIENAQRIHQEVFEQIGELYE